MTSEDVIHDVFVPAFRVKADVLPGRYTHLWFEPTKPGRYHLFCAEYCGTQHSGMIGQVVVMEPTDYQAWLSGGAPEGSLASAGEKLFAGPRLQHLPSPGRAGPRAGAARACSARPCSLQSGEHGRRRRSLPPRVDPAARREDRRRLPADHADLPGPGQRGAAAAS